MADKPLRRNLLLLHASLCAIVLRIVLRFGSLADAVDVAALFATAGPSHVTTGACMAAARLATRRWSHSTCLYRALTAYALLGRRDGVAFHIGAASAEGFSAHAWIATAGLPLDASARRYTSLWRSH